MEIESQARTVEQDSHCTGCGHAAALSILVLAVLAAGCGGSNASVIGVTPSPVTPVTPVASSGTTVTGTLADTVSGAVIGTFSQQVARLPARLTLTAPGHLARSTTVTAQGQTVDLIPEAGFDLEFYREFARDLLDAGSPQPLKVVSGDVSFYMQIEGTQFPAQLAGQLEAVARRVVPDLTGGRVRVARWETGTTARAAQNGTILIERSDELSNVCGRAAVGTLAGHIWLDSNPACNITATFAHEVGHALGFTHVTRPGSLMMPEQPNANLNDAPTELERRLGAIAYKRVRGNRDIDVDP